MHISAHYCTISCLYVQQCDFTIPCACSCLDSEASSADKWKGSSASSNITLVSQDTWGGLAPKSRPLVPGTSDTVSLLLAYIASV